MIETPANSMPRNTATLIPKKICVTTIEVDWRRSQGGASTRCTASSGSSPRCAASCCTHHEQIFFPKDKPGRLRPHLTQFAMSELPEYNYERPSDISPQVKKVQHSPRRHGDTEELYLRDLMGENGIKPCSSPCLRGGC